MGKPIGLIRKTDGVAQHECSAFFDRNNCDARMVEAFPVGNWYPKTGASRLFSLLFSRSGVLKTLYDSHQQALLRKAARLIRRINSDFLPTNQYGDLTLKKSVALCLSGLVRSNSHGPQNDDFCRIIAPVSHSFGVRSHCVSSKKPAIRFQWCLSRSSPFGFVCVAFANPISPIPFTINSRAFFIVKKMAPFHPSSKSR